MNFVQNLCKHIEPEKVNGKKGIYDSHAAKTTKHMSFLSRPHPPCIQYIWVFLCHKACLFFHASYNGYDIHAKIAFTIARPNNFFYFHNQHKSLGINIVKDYMHHILQPPTKHFSDVYYCILFLFEISYFYDTDIKLRFLLASFHAIFLHFTILYFSSPLLLFPLVLHMHTRLA